MKDIFNQLVTILNTTSLSTDVLQQLTYILKQSIDGSLPLFIAQSFQSIIILEQWAWQLLSQTSHEWIHQPYYQELFSTLALFNKQLIFYNDNIDVDMKVSLLFSVTISQIDNIFQQIENSHDDNDPFFTIVSLWFDIHSYFVHDNPHCNKLCITDHINQYLARHYLMNKSFKSYLSQLQQLDITKLTFTPKMLFYIKTCLCSLFSYLGSKAHHFPYTANEILHYLSNDYLQIIHIHYQTIPLWNKDLLACIGHLMAVIAKCYWLDRKKESSIKILFPTEQVTCNHVEELIHIIAYKPFHTDIKPVRSNDETVLIDSVLMMLMNIVQIENINWFIRSKPSIQEAILTVAETSLYDEVCLRAYTILGEVLTDEQLKQLNVANTMAEFFFKMLEQAWLHPSKEYKQIPIQYLLKDFQILSKNDSIQQTTANLNKISLFVDISEQYPVVYHILWTLSFNEDIQQQLRSNSTIMSKLSHLAKECDEKQTRKIVHGILWNLEINHEDHSLSEPNNTNTFDIMISYSHKEKTACQQIYDELTKAGYRVWIDYDQMHGNVMDAMAQAIEQSHTVIICMSEAYRKSNYCRAEAHYAFQRQRKIVPVLLQKHYKPDGWLLFLIGQLLYVDFNKHEFARAMTMLFEELKAEDISEMNMTPAYSTKDTYTSKSITTTSLPLKRPQNMIDWTQTHVQDWLIEHNLIQLGPVFNDCDGRSLVYLHNYMKQGNVQQILNSLQKDSVRRTNQNISFLELSRFQSLMDQYSTNN